MIAVAFEGLSGNKKLLSRVQEISRSFHTSTMLYGLKQVVVLWGIKPNYSNAAHHRIISHNH